jgi:hypothetical protein
MMGGPSIKHLDDVLSQEMYRFRLADGRIASIWEKWIEMSPNYLAFWNKWDPGAMTPRHGHKGDHINFIIQGEISCGDIVCRAGTHIMLEYGDLWGPWTAGPEGVELYGFVAAVGGSGGGPYPRDLDSWNAFLKEQGAESLPVPMPRHLPPWWEPSAGQGRAGGSGHANWVEE